MRGLVVMFSEREKRVLRSLYSAYQFCKKLVYPITNYLFRVLAAVSQLVNALLGGNSSQTLSGRLYRKQTEKVEHEGFKPKVWRALESTINFVFTPLYKDHCAMSTVRDIDRAKSVLRGDS